MPAHTENPARRPAGGATPDHHAYAAFLPEHRRKRWQEPTSDWWEWRGHRVHLLRTRDATAAARLLVVHGAGAHAEALWPAGSLLVGRGLEVSAVDLPLYGRTRTLRRGTVTYDDWIDLLVDLVAAEDDGRPLFLLGASIGGLLAVEVAARSGRVAAVAATCLLDPLDRPARAHLSRFGSWGVHLIPLLRFVRPPLTRLPIKVGWVAHLARMGRNPALGRLCASDPRGGGAWVPLGFLASYLHHPHEALRSRKVRVHLVHPELDDWTPLTLSEHLLASLPGETNTVVLRACGHFPLEEPGLEDLVRGIEAMVRDGRVPKESRQG